MKKLLLFLIALITFTNVSYASFPITEKNNLAISTTINFEYDEEDDGDEPSLLESILMSILVLGVLGFSLYFLIKFWWRAWVDRVKWVRILTFIILGILALFLILGIICASVKGGCVYNMA